MDGEAAYQVMADLTLRECAACPQPYACCVPAGCASALAHLKTRGKAAPPPTDHPSLRFMGEQGCILAPHQRPRCTTWCCALQTEATRRQRPELRVAHARALAGISAMENDT